MEGEIIRLKRECSWTQDQLQRVLKELKFYQVKYPTPFMNAVSDETSDENLPVWISSPELLGPLITSYDASKWQTFNKLQANLLIKCNDW